MSVANYFYESSGIVDFDTNITYHELLSFNDQEFDEWIDKLRQEIIDQWDGEGIPPTIGKDESEIIRSFKKLRGYDVNQFYIHDKESLGIIRNFNKDANVVNQFFPTMLKTRISTGKSADGGTSIYDYFKEESLKPQFKNSMERLCKRDAMYSYSKSIFRNKKENEKDLPFDGEEGAEWLRKYINKTHYGVWVYKYKKKENAEDFIQITPDEIRELHKEGVINDSHISNIDPLDILDDHEILKSGKRIDYIYLIRYYDKSVKIFPAALQVFRLGLGQPAVNFPALTAKWIYQYYTKHVDGKVTVYDPSAGWGGRIIGAMSVSKDLHYVGTDPNPDNFISDLGKTRYEYVAKYFNDNCVRQNMDVLTSFFDMEDDSNTYEVFSEGSELVGNNPDFQKYKGKLDLVFTSPPYFNREQYSQDENQSFKAYPKYEDWRDNFLKPTLKTAYDYLKNDRYILWNIADIKVGKNEYFPLQKDSIDILVSLGCEYKGFLKMLMSSMMGLDVSNVPNSTNLDGTYYKYEPILVFYKQ